MLAVWVYLGYSVVDVESGPGPARARGGPDFPGPLGHPDGLDRHDDCDRAGLVRFRHLRTGGARRRRRREGPDPAWAPASRQVLPIQVIAQQWEFTYRYPTFGGFETRDLVLPADTTIAFHVTSLDVIHSFWAYQLGVKADANPGYDNVAYTRTTGQLGQFTVRCSELCGIWHGAMYNYGRVMSVANFMTWATVHPEVPSRRRPSCCPPFLGPTRPTPTGRTAAITPTTGTPTATWRTTGPYRRRSRLTNSRRVQPQTGTERTTMPR